ncbi:MAG: DNA polymerase III subunit alpha [Deltaproteobacteria bacterium]|nr:DNA polymerase III subunit alpha [Deltaproteobacteria bacterium]
MPEDAPGPYSSEVPLSAFVHLHVHSHYSLMRGVSSPEALCRAARSRGYDTLAITDTNGFHGLINFLETARRNGIHPIVGAHLKTRCEEAVALARTERGYSILSEIISRIHLRRDFSLLSAFPQPAEDVTLLTAQAELIKTLRDKVPCRVEVLPGPEGRKALEVARELGVPAVATGAVHFAHEEDYPLHRLVRAIQCNCTLSTLPPEEVVHPERWLKPAYAMEEHFPHCREAMANAAALAADCRREWDFSSLVFPHFDDRKEDHFELLLQLCRKGIPWRYNEWRPDMEARLQEELVLIRQKGYVDYFLVVADIVGRRPIHCGRGSAAASLVSYLLGITHVDPIGHGLLFGRFLNPQRQDPPDIDVDFPWDERDDLLEEIREHYGDERFASVANHTGFGARAAVREVAKIYGIPAEEIREVTRRLSSWTDPEGIGHRVERHPKFQGFPMDPPWPEILQWAGRLQSLPRHLSTHCGGIILTPDPVCLHVPVEPSRKGGRIIQWEKDQAERAGLVKIDLLGNRSLAVIRDTLEAVHRNGGKRIDYAAFNPLDDPVTQDLLRRGDTMGVFYVESPAMRQLQRKTGRGDFRHLVIHSSIIRPAANRHINEYIRRLHGAPFQPLHTSLAELLRETYGILVYQEDVVQVSMALAGFDWGEADGLRKVISKKSPEQIEDYRARFFAGCQRCGVPMDVTGQVWEMILSFAGYSFCKPHSASYALVSFKSAFLKAHHPAEFMAAVLSNGGGYYSTLAYISEARRMGLTVKGPDINESDWSAQGRDRTVRLGLQQIRSLDRETVEGVLSERERGGPFTSLDDLLRRIRLNPADGVILAKSGALDSLAGNLSRPQLLWLLQARAAPHAPVRALQAAGQLSLFSRPSPPANVPPLPQYTPRQFWRQEEETLGFVLSVHPLSAWQSEIRAFPQTAIRASELPRYVGRPVWVTGWPITRKEVLTKAGDPMEFVSFEDETAIYETVFFPEAFRRFCQDMNMESPYLLHGQVQEEFGAMSLSVRQVVPVTRTTSQRARFRHKTTQKT